MGWCLHDHPQVNEAIGRKRMKAEGGDSKQWKPKSNPWLIAATVALAAFMEVLDTSIANWFGLSCTIPAPGPERRQAAVVRS
jgi:hypothetical protein